MKDLNFRSLDKQIEAARKRLLQEGDETDRWDAERQDFEERIRALEEELVRLRKAGQRLAEVESENAKYRRSREKVREQVGRMLEKIRSLES